MQTQVSHGHWLETGDVLTLLPDGNSNNRTQTQQNIVRFVSKDGFGTGVDDSYNANDDWFTFVEPVTETRFDWEILVGRGWSGPEMSVWWNGMLRGHDAFWDPAGNGRPHNPSPRPGDPPAGILPRIDIHQTGGPAQLHFGRRDPGAAQPAKLTTQPLPLLMTSIAVQRAPYGCPALMTNQLSIDAILPPMIGAVS